MEAIVLAGGFGTRLRQVVADVPKPMAPIAGRPFLEILLTLLADKGFVKVIISVGFMAETITKHFGFQFKGMVLDYVVEDQPLGTGGGVRLAMSRVNSDHVFVFNGDTFLDLEVYQLQNEWLSYKRPIIVGKFVPDTARYGRLLTAKSTVAGFTEKGVSGPGLVNAGCYIFHKRQLDGFDIGQAFSLETEFLIPAVSRGEFDVFETHGLFVDIGVPECYARAQVELFGL